MREDGGATGPAAEALAGRWTGELVLSVRKAPVRVVLALSADGLFVAAAGKRTASGTFAVCPGGLLVTVLTPSRLRPVKVAARLEEGVLVMDAKMAGVKANVALRRSDQKSEDF